MIDLLLLAARYLLLLLIYVFIFQVLRAIHVDLRDLLPRRGRKALLEVQESPGDPAPGTHFPLDDEMRIGQGAHCAVVLPGDGQPAEHARIVFRGGRFWVENPAEVAGTLVNGMRVREPWPLRDGDRVAVAGVVFRFQWSDL